MDKQSKAYVDLGDVLGTGLGVLMLEGDQYAEVPLDQIAVDRQMREEFEDEEGTLDEMAASIRKLGVLQPVLLRPVEGGARPYKLVAGERRYIGSERAGKACIPAVIRVMTDEEAEDAQLAENIQRKNLTQIELAKRIQYDLDTLGSVDAVLEKHAKGRAWLSKILALLTLPEQTKRLVTERISADLEVINRVRTVERLDPLAARTLVDDLKVSRGKADARKLADAAKEQVKPLSRPGRRQKASLPETGSSAAESAAKSKFAEAKIDSVRGREAAKDFGRVGREGWGAAAPEHASRVFRELMVQGRDSKQLLGQMSDEDKHDLECWLESYYDAGVAADAMARAVLLGFRSGTFAVEDVRVFALLAFLQGADATVPRFDLALILRSV